MCCMLLVAAFPPSITWDAIKHSWHHLSRRTAREIRQMCFDFMHFLRLRAHRNWTKCVMCSRRRIQRTSTNITKSALNNNYDEAAVRYVLATWVEAILWPYKLRIARSICRPTVLVWEVAMWQGARVAGNIRAPRAVRGRGWPGAGVV